MFQRLDGGLYVVGNATEASVVSFSNETGTGKGKQRFWAYWFNSAVAGESDREPAILLDLIKNNNLQVPLLNTLVDFVCGSGIGLFRRETTGGKQSLIPVRDAVVENWLQRNDCDEIMERCATDLYYLGNFFVEGRLQGDRTVYSVKHQQATDVRAELINKQTGRIEHYYLGDFLSGKAKYLPNDPVKSTITKVRAFNPAYPPSKWIWHGKKYFPGSKYYGIPAHWGVKNWIKLANQIPVFHLSGLTKGYNIRWHLKVPVSYFDQFPPERRDEKEAELMSQLDALLSGADNHGKAFISRYQNDRYPEWKIEPLKGELYDQAYRDIFEQSNRALSSAAGVDPSLAGFSTEGKLSSGSEKKNSYNIHVSLKTPRPRKLLLGWLYDVARINRWNPELEFHFRDIEIQSTDENPTGTKQIVTG